MMQKQQQQIQQNLTNKYNAELAKQAKLNISPADLAKSQNLSEQINKEVTNISTKIDQIGTQSSDLALEINTLNLEIENLSRINSVDSSVQETVIPSN